MDFAALPPEINSGRMYAGPGTGPLLAAAAAWDALATELQSTAASYGTVISDLTGSAWAGPASASMAGAVTPYLEWMNAAATQSEQTAAQAKAAAAAFESAFAMTVPPPVIDANRDLLTTLVATNLVGQNTMAIAATEAAYAEMWAQDAAAMYGYAASSAVASTLTPFTAPPQTTNPSGAAAQVSGASQAATSSGTQLMSSIPQALQSLASSTTSAAATPADALGNTLTGIIIALTAVDIPVATVGVGASTSSATASFTSVGTNYRGFLINADRDFAAGKGPFTGYGPGAAMVPEWLFGGPSALAEASSAPAPSVMSNLGQATTVGRLSVPPAWTVAAPGIRPTAFALPITAATGAPELTAGVSNNWLSDMALAGAAGRAVTGNSAARPAERRVRFLHHESPKSVQSHSDQVTDMATKLQAITEMAQSLLAKLAESGVMTPDEVSETRHRFPW